MDIVCICSLSHRKRGLPTTTPSYCGGLGFKFRSRFRLPYPLNFYGFSSFLQVSVWRAGETGLQPVQLVNSLCNWPTVCATGQQSVQLVYNLSSLSCTNHLSIPWCVFSASKVDLSMAQQPLVSQSLLIIEASRSLHGSTHVRQSWLTILNCATPGSTHVRQSWLTIPNCATPGSTHVRQSWLTILNCATPGSTHVRQS
jgi:hypothetical protein